MPGLIERIQQQAQAEPSKPAFVYDPGDGAVEITYAAFMQQAQAAAQQLRDRGGQPGDRVVLFAGNSPRWCTAYLAIHMAGMTVVPLDAGYTEREVGAICTFVEPAAAICDAEHDPLLPACVSTRIGLDEWAYDAEATAFEPVPLADGQPLSIIFTSGTTGDPKGVMLSERNILSNVEAVVDAGFVRHRDRPLLMLPLHHVYACTVTFLSPLCAGGTLVFPKSIKGEDIGAAIREQGVTIFPTVPQVLGMFRKRMYDTIQSQPFFKRLAFSWLARLNRCCRAVGINTNRVLLRSVHKNFPKLRFFAAGGARLEPDVFHDLQRLGFKIVEAYGLTETSPLVTMNTPKRQVAGAVGQAIPGVEVRIDPSDPSREAGEVCVRGPNVMMGYYKNPDATAKVIKDGWFHTGDLGYLDEKGNLFLTGRAKEIIVLPSGKNIYPEELEKHYAQPEAIEEVCVLSLPAKDGQGENLTAVVYPNMAYFRRYKAGNLLQDVKYVIENVALQLPSYQRVTRVELASEPFPRTRLSKLKRFQVRKELEQRLAGAAPQESSEPEATETDDPLLQFVMDAAELTTVPDPKSNLETDLGLDSLSKLELLSAFEKQFGVKIGDDDATEIMAIEHLRRFLPEGAAAASGAAGADAAESLLAEPDIPLEEHVDTGHGWWGEWQRLAGYCFGRLMLKLLFKVEITGEDNIPAEGPFIVAANHTSYFDAVVAYAGMPWRVARRMYSLSLPQIFGAFPLSLLRRRGRIIMTGTHDTTLRSMQYCAKVLEMGEPMCIFPEGMRSADGLVGQPKRGVGILAHERGAPLLPVFISGANNLLSRTHPGFRLTKIKIDILPPIDASLPGDAALEKWFELMREKQQAAASAEMKDEG